MRHSSAGQRRGGHHIGGIDCFVLFICGVLDTTECKRAGVVHEDVQTPISLDGCRHDARSIIGLGQIGDELGKLCCELFGKRRQRRLAPTNHQHAGVGRQKSFGDRLADACAAAGHDYNFRVFAVHALPLM